MNDNQYVIPFEECQLVKGYNKHLLYDLVRGGNSNEVPDSFSIFWERIKESSIKELRDSYEEKYHEIVNQYINFIIDRQFGVKGDYHLKTHLTPYPNNYESSSTVENAIMVLFEVSVEKINKIIPFLEQIGVKAIEIRILNYAANDFRLIEELFEDSIIETIIQRAHFLNDSIFKSHSDNFIRTKEIHLYDAPYEREEGIITCSVIQVDLQKDWESKGKKPFVINRRFFIEGKKHHTYFNHKLYIGPKGEIKNAPECEEIFGNIQDFNSPAEIKKIIDTPEFQKYWYVHKEITDVCKDCEFRHMCVDNRIPYKRKQNEWYHKQECNYNPYIAKWKGEEGYRTLAECGVISNEKEFSIDHEKIAKINEELWID